jgi:hypothetical protein
MIRLACMSCDRDDCDGIDEIPEDWHDVSEWDEETVGCWWTHMGDCPECWRQQNDS